MKGIERGGRKYILARKPDSHLPLIPLMDGGIDLTIQAELRVDFVV